MVLVCPPPPPPPPCEAVAVVLLLLVVSVEDTAGSLASRLPGVDLKNKDTTGHQAPIWSS
jgi:hypothetical protein